MMKKTALFLSIFCLLFAYSCKDDDVQLAETTSIELNFKALYGSETLMTEKGYDYNGHQIKISKFDFYVANTVLLQQGNAGMEETEIRDIEFVDLSFDLNNPTLAEAGVSITSRNVEVGQYDGIKFGIGVPADLNRTDHTQYASEHPLALSNHYWPGWDSYIFVKLEGAIDLDDNGTYESSFSFHTGTDQVYFEKQFTESLNLTEDVATVVPLFIDVKSLFESSIEVCDGNNDGYMDLDVCFGTHTIEDFQIALEITNQFQTAISMQP